MTIPPAPTVTVSRYEVTARTDRTLTILLVEHMGADQWAIHDGHGSYAPDGTYTPGVQHNPHRYSHDEALNLAGQIAQRIATDSATAAADLRASHAA
ncbi:hypothetical protein [Streptomyces lavendulocolor]|uniref:hypothetical protein n=1 Tax=Streptomyces lavendulocolor TaxID=67316 RepID=UPI0033EA85DE